MTATTAAPVASIPSYFFSPKLRLPQGQTQVIIDPYDSCEEEADWIRGHSLGVEPVEAVQNELADHENEGNHGNIGITYPLYSLTVK